MTTYRKKSGDILNQADALDAIINWQLFAIDQDQLLWGGKEGEWRPGEPLFEAYYDNVSGHWLAEGNVARPMFQIYYDNIPHVPELVGVYIRCEICNVSWAGNAPCWMCGLYKDKSEVWWRLRAQLRHLYHRWPTDEEVDERLQEITDAQERARQLRQEQDRLMNEIMAERLDGVMVQARRSARSMGDIMRRAFVDVETFEGPRAPGAPYRHMVVTFPRGYARSAYPYVEISTADEWLGLSYEVNVPPSFSRAPFVLPDISRRYDPWAEVDENSRRLVLLSTREKLRLALRKLMASRRLYNPIIAEPVITRGNPHLEEYLRREESNVRAEDLAAPARMGQRRRR